MKPPMSCFASSASLALPEEDGTGAAGQLLRGVLAWAAEASWAVCDAQHRALG